MSHSHEPTFAPQGPASYRTAGPGVPPQAPGGPSATPPQQQKSWFARHKLLTALLVVLALVIIGALVGGGDDDSSTTGTAAEPSAAPAHEETAGDEAEAAAEPVAEEAAGEPDEVPGIGEPVRDGKFEFTVTEVETGVAEVGNEWLSEQAQGQFVLVHMTVSNIGDEAQMLSGSNQALIDSEGREHSANSSAGIYLDESDTFLNDINPGNSVAGIVVFDIPTDAEPASVELHDSVFSGGVTVSLAG